MKPTAPNLLARCLRDYFTDHLPRLRGMSAHTTHSYRDGLVLLLRFVASNGKRDVCDLDMEDIQPDSVLVFLPNRLSTTCSGVRTQGARVNTAATVAILFRLAFCPLVSRTVG